MLAAKRTDRVMGRIILLIISMITIKGIRGTGVPVGTRWARNSKVLLIVLYKMKAIHRGRARERVIARWLVAVNVKEINPKVLFERISINKAKNSKIFDFLALRRMENSFSIALLIFSKITL